ncbi:hypothetical protein AB1Y20_009394 [Prymnesium parvum]|uniref:Uncharacterized protein n=1 Tax=Prymnesium parvum TaxID=97485 RepID=A0AB34K5K2_PRYPA
MAETLADRSMPLLPLPALIAEAEECRSGTSASPRQPGWRRQLGLLSVTMILFFNVSGGPLGSEQIVSSVGPLPGLSLLLAFGILFSLPQAMVTAEMSTAFPQNGGYSLWVQAAFGDFWGLQESYWSWFSGVVDSALYPVLLYSSAAQLLAYDIVPSADQPLSSNHSHHVCPKDSSDDSDTVNLWVCIGASPSCAPEYLAKLAILLVFTSPNLVSVSLVGRVLTTLGVLVLIPFVLLCLVGIPQVRFANLVIPPVKPDFANAFSVVYWSLSGFDAASTFAGEVDQPGSTIPRALFTSVGVMLFFYLVPLTIAAGADPKWICWLDGSLSTVGYRLGGEWLAVLVLISSCLGNWGLFASELLEDTYQLLGMAECGLAPRCFSKRHSVTGTPVRAILFQLGVIALLIGLDFSSIMCVDNFFSAAAAILEFAAIVKLRISRPHMARPYMIPLGTNALSAMVLVPCIASCGIMWITMMDSWTSMVICLMALLLGIIAALPFARPPSLAQAFTEQQIVPTTEVDDTSSR